jgi:two-component system chemotaxis response regulator CheY
MMPKVDGVKTLRAIRELEKQYDIAQDKRVKIIMTTALAEAQLVRTAFEYGCEAYAAKPIDTPKLIEVMGKLGLIREGSDEKHNNELKMKTNTREKGKNTAKRSMQKKELSPRMLIDTSQMEEGYFQSVCALPDYQLEVTMKTGTTIHFDFRLRLNTARFGMLRDEELFKSVNTDGNYLTFSKAGRMPVKITASEFMDLVLIDRGK